MGNPPLPMNILPFVLTFLLLLTVMSSFLFHSVVTVSREKEIVLTEHQSYLQLLSKQNEKAFKKKIPKKPKGQGEERKSKQREHDYFRDERTGADGTKLNLWPLTHGSSPQVKEALEKSLLRLFDILYMKANFYEEATKNKVFLALVKEMVEQKIETFEGLVLDKGSLLEHVYYQMLRGTNTGYPSITEYCRFNKKEAKPVRFRFASTPVLRAVLGEELAKHVMAEEKKIKEENGFRQFLPKHELVPLVAMHPTPGVTTTLLEELLDHVNPKKGLPQISEGSKIRAVHKAEDD